MKRRFRIALASALLLALTACMAPALLLPSPAELMLSFLEPLVGLDPNEARLFEQKMIRERMVNLLGPRYDTAIQLLRTADQLQKEGPLFFLVSRYTPLPELAEKAGLVWNADTDQMAAMLVKGDAVSVFSEVVERRIDAAEQKVEERVEQAEQEVRGAAKSAVEEGVRRVVPTWPAEMQVWLNPREVVKDAVQSAVDSAVDKAVEATIETVAPAGTRAPATANDRTVELPEP